MIVFFEANFIQVIALILLAGTLIFSRLSNWKAENFGLITRWLGVGTILLLGSVFLFNVLVDPFGWLNTGIFQPAAVQDRQEKIRLYQTLPEPPDVLIVGSSRSMILDPDQIKAACGLTAFNASISNARTEDLLSIVRYLSQKHPPQHIIIGLDITMFEPVPAYGFQAVLTPLYGSIDIPFHQRLQQYWDVLKQYLSVDMTLKSYESIKMELDGTRPPDLYTFNRAGKVMYTPYEEQIAAGTFVPNIKVVSPVRLPTYYSALDEQRIDALEKILQQDANIYLFLTPYHPAYLEALSQDAAFQARYMEIRALLERLSKKYAFSWYDFTDIASFNGEISLFYDVIHYRPENAERMVALILHDLCG